MTFLFFCIIALWEFKLFFLQGDDSRRATKTSILENMKLIESVVFVIEFVAFLVELIY